MSPRRLFLLTLALLSGAGCLASAPAAEPAPEPCLPPDQHRWVVAPGDSQRVLQVWIDEENQVLDGWSTYGRRRLRTAISRWNALHLPVQMVLVDSDLAADIEVSIVDSVPVRQVAPGASQAGATRVTTVGAGDMVKAHVLVAVAASYGVRYRLPAQEATLLHELGHALGLPHATGPRALMSERGALGTVTGTDIALARSHYARPRCAP